MKAFFEGIQWLFETIFFAPQDFLRELELVDWFLANGISWLFVIIGFVAMVYWMIQLKKFDKNKLKLKEKRKQQKRHQADPRRKFQKGPSVKEDGRNQDSPQRREGKKGGKRRKEKGEKRPRKKASVIDITETSKMMTKISKAIKS